MRTIIVMIFVGMVIGTLWIFINQMGDFQNVVANRFMDLAEAIR